MCPENFHIPVLLTEIIEYLISDKSGCYVDCTLGGGGHSFAILNVLAKNGKVIAFDLDQNAINYSKKRLTDFNTQIQYTNANFSQIAEVLTTSEIDKVDGILMDLGVSSHQIDVKGRGFSYAANGPLDMRMNNEQELTAEYIIKQYQLSDLVRVFKEYGEEKFAKLIAKEIIRQRSESDISDTRQLAEIILKVVPVKHNIKSLSRIFQSLRIEVNEELLNLKNALEQSVPFLRKGARLAVISYHSLEDRIVKNFFRDMQNPCICPTEFPICVCNKKPVMKMITKGVVIPSEMEIKKNSRSRSAKLRVAEKI